MCIEICLQCTARAVITHRETSSLSFADILTKNDLLYRNGTSHSLLDPLMPHVLDRWCADGVKIGSGRECIQKIKFIKLSQAAFGGILPHGTRRIGEAKNPGPLTQHINIASINPTSVANKKDEFHILSQTHDVHLIAAAETTATLETQTSFSGIARQIGYNTIWSPPVMPQKIRLDGQASRRGRVGGVALFSKFPCRRSWDSLPKPWDTSTRIVHSLVQFGHLWVQVFVIYGLAMPNKGAKDFTDELFHQACEQSRLLPLPTIFIGDFNQDVHSLADFPWLHDMGYRSLQQIFREKYLEEMPPTCKEATSPDTAIISPDLIHLIDKISVVKTGLFDTHDPVIFRLNIPKNQLCRHKIPLPHSWIEFPVTKSDLQEFENDIDWDEIKNLQDWGEAMEGMVDMVLQIDHDENPKVAIVPKLPKRCKGRCKPVSLKKFPIPGPVKQAWNGHYNPTQETHTIHFKRMVRQLRRITSLKKRVQKLNGYTVIWHRTIQDILTEWNVITSTVFQGTPFWKWIQNFPELQPVPWDFPTDQWLHLLEQLAKFEVDKIAIDERKIQKNIQAFRHQTDCKDANKSEAFAKTKGVQFKPFNCTKTEISELGYIADSNFDRVFEVFVSHPEDFHIGMPVKVEQYVARLIGKDCSALTIEFPQPFSPEGETVSVTQTIEHTDLPVIFDQLWEYWNQFWNRDIDDLSYDETADGYLHSLKNILPDIPEFPPFHANDIDLWEKAIKKSKFRSAPGCDGISFAEMKMMPSLMVQKLADLIELHGFPSYLLCARTIPLPKVDHLPRPEDSRPITILPTTYRLWARVVTNQILCFLGNILPPQITGMLPGRGAATASYDFQVLLEISKKRLQAITGITLDLRKCFNLIHRQKVRQLMLAWGIPETLVNKWFDALIKICRFWDIQTNCSDMQGACTGCPEGDSWSVIAMLTIAATWAHTLCSIHPSLDATAYADNWTWWCQDIQKHDECIAHTVKFTKWLGLQIDWKKTWRWSTNSEQVKNLDTILQPHTQGVCVEAPPSAWDLGAPIGYRGHTKLGKIQDRIKNGISRLTRIRNAPWDITTKAHIILASVYTLSFYACESVVIGQSHLDSFRSAVAEAILGKESKSANPAIAIHCADASLVDPSLYVILRALKEARRFLFRSDADKRKEFLFIASRPQKTVGFSNGPASALREYLLRIGWYIDKDGNLEVASHLRFNILEVSFKRLKVFLELEWQKQLVTIHTQRFHLFSFPPISRRDTIRVLSKYPPKQRLDLLKEICGAYQTKYQQSQWDKTTSSGCNFCQNAIDTKKHRLLECQMFQEQRQEHQAIVEVLTDNDEVLTEMPVIYESPFAEYQTVLKFAEPEALVPPNIVALLQENGETLHLYSDGSCQHQHSPSSRFAAYSLVADLCCNDDMRAQQARVYLNTGKIPDTLRKIGAARCGGEQHIGRAELWPITIAFENFTDFVLHTDSQYCVDTIQKIQKCTKIAELAEHNEFDLVRRIFNLPKNNQQVLKIAAHKDPRLIHNLVERYHCLGNMLANDSAIEMCLKGDALITEQFQDFHLQLVQQETHLKMLYDLHLRLQKERMKATSTLETHLPEDTDETAKVFQLEVAIQQWCPVSPLWEPPDVVTRQWLEFSAWGHQASFVILQWLQQLQWGNTDDGPNGFQMGLSWTEVAISISLMIGAWLPFRRRNSENIEHLIHPQNTANARSWGVTLSELSQNAYLLVTQVRTLIPQLLVPDGVKVGKVNSLLLQGYHAWTTGFRRRPGFPFQKEVYVILQNLFKAETKPLQTLPDICFPNVYQLHRVDQEATVIWEKRYKQALSKAKIVAKLRKG